MIEPSCLPHRVLGPMRYDLNAPLGHLSRLDARDREGRGAGTLLGLDWTLHLDQRLHAESRPCKPAMRCSRIPGREGGKMQARITRERGVELAAERGIGGLEKNPPIDAPGTGRVIAGPALVSAAP